MAGKELWKECVAAERMLVKKQSYGSSSVTNMVHDFGLAIAILRCSAASLANKSELCFLSFLLLRICKILCFSD
jgi:hypothetical protein